MWLRHELMDNGTAWWCPVCRRGYSYAWTGKGHGAQPPYPWEVRHPKGHPKKNVREK